nr:hypothetical protein [Tanacetum cinerariifolium]
MEVQVMIQCHRIKHRADVTAFEEGGQCRGETKALVGPRQVQRFHAQTVARNEQAVVVALPDGEGKHAVELGQHVGAPGVITLEQHFGVATGVEL